MDAFPLTWPVGWPRTEYPKRSAFKTPGGRATQNLMNQLYLLGAKNIVVSSNVMLRQDGLPYANQRRPEDVGVAVYFDLNGEQQCIPCDRWDLVDHNIHAIGLTVEALRGLERWGAKEMVNAAFRGFKALPAGSIDLEPPHWSQVLGVARDATINEINEAYRLLALKHHPDRGGDVELFKRLNNAYEEAKRNVS